MNPGGPAAAPRAPGPAAPVARVVGEAAARLNLRVARLSVLTAVTLTLAKLAAVVATGSLAIAAALSDSLLDVVASFVNFLAVRWSARPADEDHPYGHGKAEGLAGIAQGLVIGLLALFLLLEGGRRVWVGGPALAHAEWGIAVMLLSLVGSAWIGWLLLRTARRTGSVALAADAAHYTSDIWMNLGVLVSLVLVRGTGAGWIDGAVSLLVGAIVLRTSLRVLYASAMELMDTSLAPAEEAGLAEAVRAAVPEVRGVHGLRSRRAGPHVFVDLHLSFDRDLPFPRVHRLCSRAARAIEGVLSGARVTIHADPHPFLPEDEEPPPAPGPPGGGP